MTGDIVPQEDTKPAISTSEDGRFWINDLVKARTLLKNYLDFLKELGHKGDKSLGAVERRNSIIVSAFACGKLRSQEDFTAYVLSNNLSERISESWYRWWKNVRLEYVQYVQDPKGYERREKDRRKGVIEEENVIEF
jgi:hypothetical protein